ncbi:unnamed protein product [Brassica oleracea var. botrytis]
MVRCFALHDVYSQPQHSARQRRQEIMNERGGEQRGRHGSSSHSNFQRQSLQQLLPGAFDQDDYDEWKKAEALFLDLQVTKHTKFYWKYLNTLQELKFWHKFMGSWISTVGNTTKRTTLGHTAKCATMGHTAKSTTMGCTAWFSTRTVNCTTMGHTTNCTTVGHTTECSTMGHTTECSAMEHTAEYSAMRHTTEC